MCTSRDSLTIYLLKQSMYAFVSTTWEVLSFNIVHIPPEMAMGFVIRRQESWHGSQRCYIVPRETEIDEGSSARNDASRTPLYVLIVASRSLMCPKCTTHYYYIEYRYTLRLQFK